MGGEGGGGGGGATRTLDISLALAALCTYHGIHMKKSLHVIQYKVWPQLIFAWSASLV